MKRIKMLLTGALCYGLFAAAALATHHYGIDSQKGKPVHFFYRHTDKKSGDWFIRPMFAPMLLVQPIPKREGQDFQPPLPPTRGTPLRCRPFLRSREVVRDPKTEEILLLHEWALDCGPKGLYLLTGLQFER